MEAAGPHPLESDPIRGFLYDLFAIPFITTGNSRHEDSSLLPGPHTRSYNSMNSLLYFLHIIRRMIIRGGYEAYLRGAIDIFARQVIALAGGLILIIPIIMMTFLTKHHARLIIVCCFVVLFAFLIGIFTTATNQEVLAATAVYTAVLAVFITAST